MQAWDLYYHVFRRISRQLPQLTQLELQYVSPKLLMCRDLELAVPGKRMICQSSIRARPHENIFIRIALEIGNRSQDCTDDESLIRRLEVLNSLV
jgi:FKBP12-rapamycin complex-associated protein